MIYSGNNTGSIGEREQYRLLFNHCHNLISVIDENGVVLMANESLLNLVSCSREEIEGRTVRELVPEQGEKVLDLINLALQSGKDMEVEESFDFPGGTRCLVSHLQPLSFMMGGKRAVQITSYDITRQKETEKKLEESLREKELLLREIHHRVKNNMQIISSLLDLQYHRVVNIADRQLFLDSQNRVRALALVHEKLYQSDSMTRIDFENYIQGLIGEYNDTLGSMTRNVTIDIMVKDVFMEINDAIPCALIINELLTNALKHAFPGGRKGTVRVEFSMAENGLYSLLVSDNGVGFPPDFDIQNSDSLGMQLIHALTHQLKGTISPVPGKGTSFSLVFGHAGRSGDAVMSFPGPGSIGRSLKIMIVEDERITGLHIKGILDKAGYTVSRIISRGADVLPAITLDIPDLILLDIFLEDDMSGIDVAQEIRKHFSVPFVFVSANTDQEVMQRALRTEPAGYLNKPIDKIELIGVIEKILVKTGSP